MFYILNFFDHSFKFCVYPEEVTEILNKMCEASNMHEDFVEDYFVIINASDPDLRYTHDEFMKSWMN